MKVSSDAQKLIDEINEKYSRKRFEKECREKNQKDEFITNLSKIKEFDNRIFDLWSIAEALLENEIDISNFQTDAFHHHHLGFFINEGEIKGFGIMGDSWGDYNLVLSKEGNPTSVSLYEKYFESGEMKSPWNVSYIAEKVQKVVSEFDDYEKKLMDFAYNILNE